MTNRLNHKQTTNLSGVADPLERFIAYVYIFA